MELRVVGCHGGETPHHRTSAFVVDDRLAIDAGSLTQGLDLKLQFALAGCLISHAHLDHIKDLATIADNRCQAECDPLPVVASAHTLKVLKKHFFNNLLWPDFSTIPSPAQPTIRFVELKPGHTIQVGEYRIHAINVSHTVPTTAFIVRGSHGTIAYSGDTGPTDELWQHLRQEPDLRALLLEVSFPNREQKLATMSGHHTPRTLAADLRKYGHPEDLPTLLYHIKPFYQREVEKECARLRSLNLTILGTDDQYVL